jgi:hypothetical protein
MLLVLNKEWLALYRSFSSGVGVKFAQSSSQLESRADTGRIYQTLLTNKKQGNPESTVHAANIIRPTQTRINHEKYTFCVIKSLEHLKS